MNPVDPALWLWMSENFKQRTTAHTSFVPGQVYSLVVDLWEYWYEFHLYFKDEAKEVQNKKEPHASLHK